MRQITQVSLAVICNMFGLEPDQVESIHIDPDTAEVNSYDPDGRLIRTLYHLVELNDGQYAKPIVAET
jgi:hypothetical protein